MNCHSVFDKQSLLADLGEIDTAEVVPSLRRFAFLPDEKLSRLAGDATDENWGKNNFALEKYLAVHIIWSILQERYTHSSDQLNFAAGHLQSTNGTPLYLVFKRNDIQGKQPWVLRHVGKQIAASNLPLPARVPDPPDIVPGSEIVICDDHIFHRDNERVKFLHDLPPVTQICAVTGAIQWSLHRALQVAYYHYGKISYLVPLYFSSRENLRLAPELVAPVEVHSDRLLVRTLLYPCHAYANARVTAERADQLPAWLIDAWEQERCR